MIAGRGAERAWRRHSEGKTPPSGSEADILLKKKDALADKGTESQKGAVVYKVQILTSDKKLPAGSRQFKGYHPVDYYKEKGLYKYTYGETTNPKKGGEGF